MFDYSIILVNDEKDLNLFSISNAFSLIGSITSEIKILARESLSTESKLRIDEYLSLNTHKFNVNQSTDLSCEKALDEYLIEKPILIVVIGDISWINSYLTRRCITNQSGHKWQVVSSEYARYRLIENQRQISDYIPNDTSEWILELIKKHSVEEILNSLKRIKGLKIVIIGEVIIDEYIISEALGKTSKDPLLAFLKRDVKIQAGGIFACARHAVGLGATVEIFSAINKKDLYFFEKLKTPNLNFNFLFWENAPTIRKTRFIDSVSNNKVFESYEMNIDRQEIEFESYLIGSDSTLKEADLILIFDYGHGLLTNSTVSLLSKYGSKVYVNAQSNAGNRGFNPISKYSGFKTMFMNGSEVSLEMRQKSIDINSVGRELVKNLQAESIFVTNGSSGVTKISSDGTAVNFPAFAPTIVDRTGAGDALMVTIALLNVAGIDDDISGYYGNLSGSVVISSIGNEKVIETEELIQMSRDILRKTMGETAI